MASIDTTVSTYNLLATPTTVNAFAGASVALNIGNAAVAAAFPGGISIPTGKTLSGAGAINITGAISGTTGTFSGAVSLATTTTGNKVLNVGSAPADNSSAVINLLGSSAAKNWQIGMNNTAGGLNIIPSTAAGGSTFTTPVLTLTDAGLAVTGTLRATGILSVNGASVVSAAAGDIVVFNAKGLRGANAANNTTYPLIGVTASDVVSVGATGNNLIINTASSIQLNGLTATRAAGDVYVVIDASGNLKRSAVGPAS